MFDGIDLKAFAPRRADDIQKPSKRGAETSDLYDDPFGDTAPASSTSVKKPKSSRVSSSGGKTKKPESESEEDYSFFPKDDGPIGSSGISVMMRAGMKVAPPVQCAAADVDLDTDDHEHIRANCEKRMGLLRTFADVHGAWKAKQFAEQYEPESTNGKRSVSGLLFFGPSGTGKTLL